MFDDEKGGRIPDDFWDISSLVPKKNFHVPVRPSIEAVEVEVTSGTGNAQHGESTVIERMIPPRGTIPKREEYTETVISYSPSNSLLHEVTVKKKKTQYPFYEEFCREAKRLAGEKGSPCDYIPYFSYSPQYDQLSEEQLAYYLWWRENARRDVYLKTDYSYTLLYVYELINLGASVDSAVSLRQLTGLWNAYHTAFPSLNGKLATWICDFGLIHGLPPAENATGELVRQTAALMEYYIAMPDGDTEHCADALLKYCTAYDYHTSKFAKEENLPYFDRHIRGALIRAVDYFSENGKMLSRLAGEDSLLTREAFAGALCASSRKCRLEVRYCSFSRTNELRYLVGDIIKYAENKLRAWLGVKSKLSVYSLSSELCGVLDGYFATALTTPRVKRVKKEEKQAYDVLYDIPKKPFSLEAAQRIEQESWETTDALLEAFDSPAEWIEDSHGPFEEVVAAERAEMSQEFSTERGQDGGFLLGLGELAPFARSVLDGDRARQRTEAERLGRMPDAIVDEINSKAFEELGDILIEGTDDVFAIIECYRDVLKGRSEEDDT